MEIKDRIKMIMEREQITPRVFAETIKVQQSTLSHILKNRNKPSLDVIMKVHQTYSYVNLEWLLYGTGEMTSAANGTSPSDFHDQNQFAQLDENGKNSSYGTIDSENRKETALQSGNSEPKEIVKQEIKYVEKPARRITEIRIFFDDNTYETFKPEK